VRVLITSMAGHGHFAPLIPLAVAIRDAGHEVAFATSETCRAGLAVHGLTLMPCGPIWHESQFGRSPKVHSPLADLAEYFDPQVLPKMLADVSAVAAAWQPDVVLSDDFEPVGRVVAERSSIPFVLASSGPRLAPLVRASTHGPMQKTARRLAGLGEGNELSYSLHWLHLCFSPEEWAYTGPMNRPYQPYAAAPKEVGIRPRLADLGHPPTPAIPARLPGAAAAVLCTFGTVFNKRPEVLRTVIQGVAEQVGRLQVVLGPGLPPGSLGDVPPLVQVLPEASVHSLLPAVDFVITHGGAGTLTALQLHGKPSLLLPQGADQFINSAATQRVRSGVVRFHSIGAAAIGADGRAPLTSESVGQAFAELARDGVYRERANWLRREYEALPPLEIAVELIERLASTKQPIVAAQRRLA
jgi:UDP:flavonoid glycosyltransferase YjiC (YdhE family)